MAMEQCLFGLIVYWVLVPRLWQGAAGASVKRELPLWTGAVAAPCPTQLVPAASNSHAAGHSWPLSNTDSTTGKTFKEGRDSSVAPGEDSAAAITHTAAPVQVDMPWRNCSLESPHWSRFFFSPWRTMAHGGEGTQWGTAEVWGGISKDVLSQADPSPHLTFPLHHLAAGEGVRVRKEEVKLSLGKGGLGGRWWLNMSLLVSILNLF